MIRCDYNSTHAPGDQNCIFLKNKLNSVQFHMQETKTVGQKETLSKLSKAWCITVNYSFSLDVNVSILKKHVKAWHMLLEWETKQKHLKYAMKKRNHLTSFSRICFSISATMSSASSLRSFPFLEDAIVTFKQYSKPIAKENVRSTNCVKPIVFISSNFVGAQISHLCSCYASVYTYCRITWAWQNRINLFADLRNCP